MNRKKVLTWPRDDCGRGHIDMTHLFCRDCTTRLHQLVTGLHWHGSYFIVSVSYSYYYYDRTSACGGVCGCGKWWCRSVQYNICVTYRTCFSCEDITNFMSFFSVWSLWLFCYEQTGKSNLKRFIGVSKFLIL